MTLATTQDRAPAVRQWRRLTLSSEVMIILVCLWFVVTCNGSFWESVQRAQVSTTLAIALGVALFALHAFLIGLIAWGRAARPVLATLLITTAIATWYMDRYAVVFDTDMIRNIAQTDPAETREMLSVGLMIHVTLLGLLPAVALCFIEPAQLSLRQQVHARLPFLLAMLLLAVGALLPVSQGVFSLMRTDTLLRYRITPGNYVVSGLRALMQSNATVTTGDRRPIATDAVQSDTAASRRPRLLVLVVGETVRGDHWGLNGYERQTTPRLALREGLVNFPDVSACGTSTAVSLPCMFSPLGREHYDHATVSSQQSLLDVLARVGIAVLWRDNQAGCKGVCDGVTLQEMPPAPNSSLCRDGRCLDEVLLQGLPEIISGTASDQLLVLHMLGNHGPNYFERYPPTSEHFTPTCRSADLSRCGRNEITNAYDNAVRYTDEVLDRLIDLLAVERDRDVAMLYLSDHGESLGEYGLYLHGAPYHLAPRAQLHVPMTLWMSPSFEANAGIDTACLRNAAREPISHDYLYSTVLGIFDVRTSTYTKARDVLDACRQT